MKSLRRRALFAGCCLFGAALGGALTVVAQDSQKESDAGVQSSPGLQSAERSVSEHITNVDGTRTVSITFTATKQDYTFDEDSEIDVSAMVISNGLWSSQAFNKGGFYLYTPTNLRKLAFSFDSFGVQSITFPQPMKLRTGDRTSFVLDAGASTFTAPFEIVLIGTAPKQNVVIIK